MSDFIPNSFQVPNALIDELLTELSGAELKCYLFVVRKTKGWNKVSDVISISQLMEATGLSNRAVIDACNRLTEIGLLARQKGARGVNVFTPNLCKKFTCEESSHVKKVHKSDEKTALTCEKSSQDLVKKVHTQKTIKNNTTNNINSSIRKGGVGEKQNQHSDVQKNDFQVACDLRDLPAQSEAAQNAKNDLNASERVLIKNIGNHTNSTQKIDPNPVLSKNRGNPEATETPKPQSVKELLASLGIDAELAQDFITHRKAKKAPITKTVMNGFKREAEKANIALADALEVAMLQNWIGFRADWYANLNKPKGNFSGNVHGQKPSIRWNNFSEVDYYKGINPDGSF